MLGGLRVVGESNQITHFESRKTAALLAYLALHPERSHPREELAALLWPDAEFESSRNRLKQSLASLRKLLESEALVFEADRFAVRLLPNAIETDVAQWERLARTGQTHAAAALWNGELLPGFYDDCLVAERERLNALKEKLCPDTAFSPERTRRLPNPLTRFIGRETECAAIAELLRHERWVTLTGPGGMGKTRLAIEVARQQPQHDIYFVSLVELTTATRLPSAIAATVGLSVATTQAPLEALCGFLAAHPTLLVLDNAEHLDLPELTRFCQTLLERLPRLRLLVTSRHVLGGSGELRFPVQTLPVQESAVPLFLDRARCVRPDFPTSREVERLCALLEGIPLALELCAAWAIGLSATQMRERLEQHDPRLLTGRDPTLPERHRSVEAAFLSSYTRLTPACQNLLRGLTVFRGGWTLEAAETICPTSDTLGDLLGLQDASLIQFTGERFTLLESLRQCAVSVAEPEQQITLEQGHRRWCRAFSERRTGERERDYLVRCDQEIDNLRQALESGFTVNAGDTVVDLLLALQLFLNLRGYNAEAADWLERALAFPDLTTASRTALLIHLGATQLEQRNQLRAEAYLTEALALAQTASQADLEALALYHLGRFAELQQLPELGRERHEQALALRRRLGDQAGIARSCNMLAQFAIQRGALAEAGPLLVEADAMARAAGRESLLADILYQRAHLTMMSGDAPGALVLLEECQEQARQFGMRLLLARVTHSLGCTAQELGDELWARAAFLEAAHTFHSLRSKLGTHFPLWYLARLYSSWEEWDVVVVAMSSAMQLWEDLARPLAPADQELLTQLRTQADEALGPQRTEHLWQQGRTLPIEEVLSRIENRLPQKG